MKAIWLGWPNFGGDEERFARW